MKERTSMLGEVGDPSAPPGSRPWAVAVREDIWSEYRDRESASEHLAVNVSGFLRHEGWKALVDRKGRPFASWEAFCRAPRPFGLGLPPEELAVEVERRAKLRAGPGRPKKGEGNAANSGVPLHHGTDVRSTLARLERDAPELAAEVIAGAKSANAAAIEAGFRTRTITVPIDPARAARALVKHFDSGQLRELVYAITRQLMERK